MWGEDQDVSSFHQCLSLNLIQPLPHWVVLSSNLICDNFSICKIGHYLGPIYWDMWKLEVIKKLCIAQV